jgi:hypothetical protein
VEFLVAEKNLLNRVANYLMVVNQYNGERHTINLTCGLG